MYKRIKHSDRYESFYCIALALYIGLLFINQTELRARLPQLGQYLLRFGRYCCYAMFIIKIMSYQYYRKRYLVAIAIGFIFALMCIISSGNKTMLFTIIALTAGYGCNWKKVLKVCTCVFAGGLICTLILCAVGVIDNLILDPDRMRYNLGFNWVTLAPIYMFFICIGYINIQRKINRLILLGLWLLSFVLFVYTDTRYTFMLTSIFLIGVFAQSNNEKRQWRVIKQFIDQVWVLPVAIFVLVLTLQFLYKPEQEFWIRINAVLSGRLSLASNSLKELPITIFGEAIQWHGYSLSEGVQNSAQYSYNNVDCSYIRLMFDYGVAGLIVTLGIYILGIRNAANSKNYLLIWSYFVVLLFSVTEQWMMELSFNMMPLVAISSISTDHNRITKKIKHRQKRSTF